MKAHFHFYVDSVDPATGGLAASANRLVSHLLSMGRTRVTVYQRSDVRQSTAIPIAVEVVPLFGPRAQIMAPFHGSDILTETSEVYRAAFLAFRAAIRPRIADAQDYRHVIVSFYISAAGFVAQQIADELNLPHIASVRGTDFNKDFRSPFRFSGVRFVLERAAAVITTSKAQEAALRPFVGERTKLHTIYNSAEPSRCAVRNRPKADAINVFSDSGFSHKKGSDILLRAVQSALLAGHRVRLTVAGATDPAALEYWSTQKRRCIEAHPTSFSWLDHVSQDDVAAELANTDIYCSASLGEGASNGLTQAMVDGLPIVATDIGAFAELAVRADHVAIVPAGDSEAYVTALLKMLGAASAGGLAARRETLEDWRKLLAPTLERYQWQEVVAEVLPKKDTVLPRRQPRVLFFVHDGIGLGHLKRIARLADAVQGPIAALVVAAHRAASWVVPEACEYVHLPSFDSLLPNRARFWRRVPFLECTKKEAVMLRRRLVEAVVEQFKPDVIVVDHFPLGPHGELQSVIQGSTALKYCVFRGVIDHTDNVRIDVLGGESEAALAETYARLLVACDKRICDPAVEYSIDPVIVRKMQHIGYVSDALASAKRSQVRAERGLAPNDRWVVCSAGGGAPGDSLIDRCIALANALPDLYFDIVRGPRSASEWAGRSADFLAYGRVRIFRESRYLAELHGAADVVVSGGGYNTLVEVMEGGAPLVCLPLQIRTNDEQAIHARRLSAFYPMEIVGDVGAIGGALERMLHTVHPAQHIRKILDFDGCDNFRAILWDDLGIARVSEPDSG